LSTAISVALLASVSVNARADSPITYVPNSLAEATITNGLWTLHQGRGRNPHDASGIVPPIPTPYNPPTAAYSTPYKNYCLGDEVQTAQAINPLQPYYFPFVRKGNGKQLEGFFDYRPRNEDEATVTAISLDWGQSWIYRRE
jgi:hypothetical protein